MCVEACTSPSPGLRELLESARSRSPEGPGRMALGLCVQNLDAARATGLPLCQDTGMPVVFAERGNRLVILGGSLSQAVNRGVSRGYLEGGLRNSLVDNPIRRVPLEFNSPAVLHIDEVPGTRLKLGLLVKGAGSENVSRSVMLPPLSGVGEVVDLVVRTVLSGGSSACPPLFVGVGIGGNLEMSGILAKKALMRPLGTPSEDPELRLLEETIVKAVNATGTGPQGFGGPVTAFEARVETGPCHMASLPVSVCLECHAHRTAERIL